MGSWTVREIVLAVLLGLMTIYALILRVSADGISFRQGFFWDRKDEP